MAMHRDRFEVKDVQDWPALCERVEAFFTVNGYERQEDGEWPSYERGTGGAGWWTSEMSKLHACYEVRLEEGAARVTLEVDTTGQHMTAEDERFWRDEVALLREYMSDKEPGGSPPEDLRAREQVRATQSRRETVQMSIYGFLITFVVLFILMVALQRSGVITF